MKKREIKVYQEWGEKEWKEFREEEARETSDEEDFLDEISHLRTTNYQIIKEEVLITGPSKRFLDGIEVIYSEKSLEIIFNFEKRSIYNAIYMISYELIEPVLNIESITLNNLNVELGEVDPVLRFIYNNASESNCVKIKVKTVEEIYYELGCVFYKTYTDWTDTTHLRMILDEWEKTDKN